MTAARVLLVTIAVGSDSLGRPYTHFYNSLFRKSHEAYAARHGYDHRVVTEFLDPMFQHQKVIVFQKWLTVCAPWAQDYDFVVVLDADTLVHPEAPAIHLAADFGDRVGMVDEYSQPTPERRALIQIEKGWERTSREYYELCGFDCDSPHVLNSGVLVLQPKAHAALFQELYDDHFEEAIGHPRTVYEQTALAYELLKRDRICILPNTWNALTGLYVNLPGKLNSKEDLPPLLTVVEQNWIVHFAAYHCVDLIQHLPERFRQAPTAEDFARWS